MLSPNFHGTLYIQISLSSVLCWDDATRQRLLFESFVLCGQTEGNLVANCEILEQSLHYNNIQIPHIGAECERLVKKKHVFDYYVSHNDRTSAANYLMSGLPPIRNSATCPHYIISLCSSMMNSTKYLKNALIDGLAK